MRGWRLKGPFARTPLVDQLAVLSGPAYAASPKAFVVTGRTAEIHGQRYALPGAHPVLLLHGVGSDLSTWERFASRLHELGFDVWAMNFRGHGSGELRSRLRVAETGSWDFIVSEDVPLMVDHIARESGRKVTLMGFSMGGMAVKLFASGIVMRPDGRMAVDRLEKDRRTAQLESVVLVSTPVDPSAWPLYVRIPAAWMMFHVLQSRISVPGFPKEIVQDGFRNILVYSARDGFDYAAAQKGYDQIPVLVVVATADPLAPPSVVLGEARKVNPRAKALVLSDAGHTSLLTGNRASLLFAERVSRFLRLGDAYIGKDTPVDLLREQGHSSSFERNLDYLTKW